MVSAQSPTLSEGHLQHLHPGEPPLSWGVSWLTLSFKGSSPLPHILRMLFRCSSRHLSNCLFEEIPLTLTMDVVTPPYLLSLIIIFSTSVTVPGCYPFKDLLVSYLRQSLTLKLRLDANSLFSCSSSADIIGLYHHPWL